MAYNKVIIALDYPSFADIPKKLLSYAKEHDIKLKVGLELFTGSPNIVELLDQYKVFLDLKFHDTPNTMAKALKKVLRYKNIWGITIHIPDDGGASLLECKKVLVEANSPIKLFGVTVLTSISESSFYDTVPNDPLYSVIMNRCRLAERHRLSGVVCDGQTAKNILMNYSSLETLVPGIVFDIKNVPSGQKRPVEIDKVIRNHLVSYFVIGRALTNNIPEGLIKLDKVIADNR